MSKVVRSAVAFIRAEDGPNPDLVERIEAVEALQDAAGEPW